MSSSLQFGEKRPGLIYRDRPSAYGVAVREGRIALVFVTLADREPFFDLPGGGVDPGESEADAVAREFGEETGFVVRAGRLIARADQFMISAHEEAFNSRGAIFEVDIVDETPELKVEHNHHTVWLDPRAAVIALRHDSHAWAVTAWLRQGGDNVVLPTRD
jgi:8-oxo-dGTP diphosphatase